MSRWIALAADEEFRVITLGVIEQLRVRHVQQENFQLGTEIIFGTDNLYVKIVLKGKLQVVVLIYALTVLRIHIIHLQVQRFAIFVLKIREPLERDTLQ